MEARDPHPWPSRAPDPLDVPGSAIGALVLGVLALVVGVVPVVSLVAFPLATAGIVCGVLAAGARAPGEPGRRMARTGSVLCALALAAASAWTVALLTTHLRQGFDDFVNELASVDAAVDAFSLQPGDCFDDPPGEPDAVRAIPAVACGDPHDNEVIAVLDYPHEPGDPYPGEDAVLDFGFAACEGDAFTDYIGTPYAESRYYVDFFYPDKRTWGFGDRSIVCFVHAPERSRHSARGRGE